MFLSNLATKFYMFYVDLIGPAATAAPPANPKFVGQLNSLITTVTGWLTGISVAAGILMVVYYAIMHMFASDENAITTAKKRMKMVLILCVVVVIASQAVNYLKSFFA